MGYGFHELLVAPARERPQLWRTVVGFITAAVIYIGLLFAGFAAISAFMGPMAYFEATEAAATAQTPYATLAMLFSFVLMAVGVGVAAQLFQDRNFASLLGPRNEFIRDFSRVMGALVILYLAFFLLPPYGELSDINQNTDFSLWLLLLPLSLLGLLIQVGAEEIVFRGYLQSQLAARFKAPLIWLLVPSLIFGFLHYDPIGAGSNAGLIAVWAVLFGIVAADLTARSGTLGPAIALHFMNNFWAILLIAPQGDLSGLALFTYPFSLSDEEEVLAYLPIDLGLMFVSWLAARLALRR